MCSPLQSVLPFQIFRHHKALLMLVVCLLMHGAVRSVLLPAPGGQDSPLARPPGMVEAGVSALGDTHWAGVGLALTLQNSDVQSGVTVGHETNRTQRVDRHEIAWLDLIQTLDPANETALTLATHIFPRLSSPAQQRALLRWIAASGRSYPEQSWRFVAFAAWFAQHQMHDRRLALSLAQTLREYAPMAPPWARQLEVFLHEKAGEYESAAALLASLLQTEKTLPVSEQVFLLDKLQKLEQSIIRP
jgi:hypothetical protein